MNDFAAMHVFFAVTTIAVIVVGVSLAYALWRLSRVLKQIEHISAQVAAESDEIRRDLADMRSDIHRGTNRFLSLFGFLTNTAKRGKKHS